MKIQITRKHLREGVRGSCASDPVALALMDAGFHDPWVTPFRIHTKELGDRETPEVILDFMLRFDSGSGFIDEFVFEI